MTIKSTKSVLCVASVLCAVVLLTRCGTAGFSGKNDVVAPAPSPVTTPAPITPLNPVSSVSAVCTKDLAISLVLDVSGSMNNDKIVAVREGASILLSALNPSDVSSLTVFNTEAKVIAPMSADHAATIGSLSAEAADMPAGNTDITAGVEAGYQQLLQPGVSAGATRILILLSDGEHNTGEGPLDFVSKVKQSGGVTIFTIVSTSNLWGQSPFSSFPGTLSGSGRLLMEQLASAPQDSLEAQDRAGLQQAFATIRQALCGNP